MTPTRLRDILHALDWSQRHLAALTGIHERQIRRMAAGANIPEGVAAWLELAMRDLAPVERARAALQRQAQEWMTANPPPPARR